ncbi:MAG: UDP-N-acetylmuramate--L-alanine ligase [Desulfobacterota bacterium]|nr:UDP-N-acetylmuramate--L-alanine ligase [Thermodesulfobacteriota bacterium]MDW8001343.1 UDP-N-acetylmuramate--L-alanine ligase [Deltaproteobacteria bacterium]
MKFENQTFHKVKKIHFVGIGGIGMSGLAEVLINLGYSVSGSDIKASELTERLKMLGAKISYGHSKENVKDVDVVVVSSAVGPDNPEIQMAKELSIPVIPRAEMLAELMRMKFGIAVCGAHGKTTTTSLIATILNHAGYDPTCVIGGKLKSIGSNARLGTGRFLVAEADESDGSFLLLSPVVAVATNIDLEHLDYYSGIEEIKKAFENFLNKVPFFGLDVICIDNIHLRSLLSNLKRKYVTYGLSNCADVKAEKIVMDGFNTDFSVIVKGEPIGRVRLSMPGVHNVVNSLAAIATCLELDIPFKTIKEALENFQGIQRRMEIRFSGKIVLIDDYGHHPTEIRATISTLRQICKGRIIVAFQPHRYTRTKALMKEFSTSFEGVDILLVTEIYAASEPKIEGVSGRALAESIKANTKAEVYYVETLDEVTEKILGFVRDGDLVLTLGAGDIYKVADRLKEIWSGI